MQRYKSDSSRLELRDRCWNQRYPDTGGDQAENHGWIIERTHRSRHTRGRLYLTYARSAVKWGRGEERNHLVTLKKQVKKRISLSWNSGEFKTWRSPKWLEVGKRIERKSPPDK